MKRFLCGLLAAMLLLSAQIFPAAHADEYSDLCDTLIRSFQNNTEVDISHFGLNEDTLDMAFVDVWYSGKLPWNAYSYSYSLNNNGVVLSFLPTYYDAENYDYARYEQAISEILSQVVFEGMTQWQKALAVHDYLIARSAYDETLDKNTNYDLLVNGTAVCSGYAMAYMDIMNRLGVECRFVESQPMLHAWNLIKIDGNWYHVDVTHDDPAPDSYGYVSHERFLKTDLEMTDLGYHGWDTDISCTDQTFADPIWKDVNSMICFLDAETFFLRNKEEWDYTITNNRNSTLYHIPSQPLTLEGDAYHYEHNGLSLWNGRLWFSDVDRVYSMLPDGSDLQTVYLYNTKTNKKFIYGSFVADGTLHLSLSDVQYGFSSMTVPLADIEYHTHNYVESPSENPCSGGITYVCECGLQYEVASEDGPNHTYEAYIVRHATCEEMGEKKYVCSVCNDSYTEAYTGPDAHDYTTDRVRDPSFFREGLNLKTCRICGYVSEEAIPRLSFQKHFGLTVWSTLSVGVLLVVIPILIGSSLKKKNQDSE